MATVAPTEEATEPTAAADQDEEKITGVVKHLQAPRKKRKNFIIFAVGKDFSLDLAQGLELYLRQNFNNYSLAIPKNERELQRFFSRQIVLVIIDDHFTDVEKTMELILGLKQKQSDSVTPVLFLTADHQNLVEHYNKTLLPYQERDNYLSYKHMPLNQICAHLNANLNMKSGRRSRRYKANIALKYFCLSKNKYFEGKLIDFSMHGGVLQNADSNEIFRMNEQLKIHLPISQYLPPKEGEYLKLAAKVRRIFMGGNQAGISWEYVTESSHYKLSRFLIEMVSEQISRFHQKQKLRAEAKTNSK